jgi:hypothetical protein
LDFDLRVKALGTRGGSYINKVFILTLNFLCTLEVVKKFVWWWVVMGWRWVSV